MSRLPTTLLGGRLRTSTAGLLLSFLAVLTLWIMIRPEPPEVTSEVTQCDGQNCVTVRTTKKGTKDAAPSPTASPTPAPTPQPTPTPKDKGRNKPTPTPVSEAPVVLPTPTPAGGGGLFFPTPTPTPTTPPAFPEPAIP